MKMSLWKLYKAARSNGYFPLSEWEMEARDRWEREASKSVIHRRRLGEEECDKV